MAANIDLWKGLRAVINGAGRRPTSDRELLRAVFNFEHTGAVRDLARCVDGIPIPDGALDDPRWQALADSKAHAEFGGFREALREDLNAIVERGGTGERRHKEIDQAANRVVLVQRRVGNKAGYRYITDAGLPAVLAHALTLLLDPDREFAADTRRCDWEACKRFFFVSDANANRDPKEPGQRRTKYCSELCMKDAWKARKR